MAQHQRANVSIDDLLLAREWLLNFEAETALDEQAQAMARVAAWLEREATRREDEGHVRGLARAHPELSLAARREIVRRARSKRTETTTPPAEKRETPR